MIFEVLLALSFLSYLVFHIRRRRIYKLASKYDGPVPIPILGNILKCLIPFSDIPDALLNAAIYYKSRIKFWFGPFLVLYLSDPKDIKTVLSSMHAINKLPYWYVLAESIVGRGLVTVPAETWKRRRRLISPNFQQQNLESFCGIFSKYSKRLVHDLRGKCGDEFFDVESYLLKCTINILFETLLGYQLDEEESSVSALNLSKLLQELVAGMTHRMSNVLYYPDCIYNLSTSGKKFREALAKFAFVIQTITQKWKDYLVRKYEEDNEHLDKADSSPPRNFVEHLLLASDEMGKLTIEELQDEIKTIITAGFDTSALVLGFLLLMLGMHDEIQEAAYEEVKNALSPNKELELYDLNNLPYLERLIKETLRLFPVVGTIGRYNHQEIKLDENHIIPKNTSIFIGIYSVHRDPDIWPNPTKFDPNRFLPEEIARRHPFSWVPFSAGPRNCIGLQFAMLSLKTMATHLIMNYKIKTPFKKVEDIHTTHLLLPKCKDGFSISITPRYSLGLKI